MATGDIYSVKINCNTNNRAWSIGVHAEEVDPSSEPNNAQIVADAALDHFRPTLQTCITQESAVEGVVAYKIFNGNAMPGHSYAENGGGVVAGESLPNENALVGQLRQIAGAARFNGKIYLSGQSDNNHSLNIWDGAYLTTFVQPFLNKFTEDYDARSPASGRWRTVILSKIFSPPTTPSGTPLVVTSAVPTTRVMTQIRRRQKVRGYS